MHVHMQALSASIFGDNSPTEEQEVLNTDSSSYNRDASFETRILFTFQSQ